MTSHWMAEQRDDQWTNKQTIINEEGNCRKLASQTPIDQQIQLKQNMHSCHSPLVSKGNTRIIIEACDL